MASNKSLKQMILDFGLIEKFDALARSLRLQGSLIGPRQILKDGVVIIVSGFSDALVISPSGSLGPSLGYRGFFAGR